MTEAQQLVANDAFWRLPEIRAQLDAVIVAALREDRVAEDITSHALFGAEPATTTRPRAVAIVTAQAAGVLCGIPGAVRVFELLDAAMEVRERKPEGALVAPGERVLVVAGSVTALLGGERTALNWLSHLSGIASQTARWVALAGDAVTVLDTRKTLPGWREFQKYAVRAGGGRNHRMHLAEFAMVKDNHRELFRVAYPGESSTPTDEIAGLLRRLRRHAPGRLIEIEVEDEASFRACVSAGVDRVLIDNQSPATIAAWVARAESDSALGLAAQPGWRDRLEASGGITGANLAAYSRSGVRRVSLGALTHSVAALDLSLRVEWE
ncbi:MAG: carboxylating nicotinate-nucleotide diphosphorylase [Planctomycetota bacterium]